MLDADEAVLRSASPDQFVKLGLNGGPVAVLRILDQEHHQERHDRRARVDDELPSLREAEERAGDGPNYDQRHAECEGERLTRDTGDPSSKVAEQLRHANQA